MRENLPAEVSDAPLTIIKIVHTVVWAFFVACIVAIPLASWLDQYRAAAWFAATVFVEVLILIFNRLQCPLTAVAARYTIDRRENFDIYLPLWLAKYNKPVFGSLYVAGVVFAIAQWIRA
jgi:membrane protein YdbS with pleckstrin-like domain